MKRRDALAALSALVGGTLVLPSVLLTGCRPEETVSYRFFTKEEIDLLEQIADTILPATEDSPGAKDVNIGAFMDIFVADCFELEEQTVLRGGLVQLGERCREQLDQGFLKLSAEQQQEFLVALDKEAEQYQKELRPGQPSHYFAMMKYLTLLGYFTSEGGATQALRYVPVPGRYEGDIPYEEGEQAWAL